jgi:hypothetical protein
VSKLVTLTIEAGENANFLAPVTAIEAEIGPNGKRDLFIMYKQDVTRDDWGEMTYAYTVTSLEQPASQTSAVEDDFYTDDAVGGVDVGTGSDLRPPPGKISCPDCTFFNDSSSFRCEICGFLFSS